MDLETLMQKMKQCIRSIKLSTFYGKFMQQMKSPQVSEVSEEMLKIGKANPNERPFQMVVYGLGSIEKSEDSRMQLALAIRMRIDCESVNNIQVFDSIMTDLDQQVMERLGCTCLLRNEEAKRTAEKPTLFYMPHCQIKLYSNVLSANWKAENINRIVILGNPLSGYMENIPKTSDNLRRMFEMYLKNIAVIFNDATTREFKVADVLPQEEEDDSVYSVLWLGISFPLWICTDLNRLLEQSELQ